jgi:hypothetical protein
MLDKSKESPFFTPRSKMAGAGTNYFTAKVDTYEPIVQQAQVAITKLAASKQALQLLSKPTLTQAEAESLIALHDQVQ